MVNLFNSTVFLIFNCNFSVNCDDSDFSEFDTEEIVESSPIEPQVSEPELVTEIDPVPESPVKVEAVPEERVVPSNLGFSDDEFEVINERPDSDKEASSPLSKLGDGLKIVKVPDRFTRSWNSFHLELVIMIGLMIYLSNFQFGKNKNARLASSWFLFHKDLLDSNFSIVGDDGINQPPTNTLLKEYEHLYSLWCTGRACIEEDSEMDNWVMAMGRKRKVAQLIKDFPDLTNYITEKRGVQHSSLPGSFLLLSEVPEATSAVLTPAICKLITTYENNIEYFHFSDQYTGAKSNYEEPSESRKQAKKVLTFVFRVGDKGKCEEENMEAMKPLLQLVLHMIDKIPRIHLSKVAKSKAEAARRAVLELRLKSQHKERQEAAQVRKDEKRRAVKERIMAEEDPERARRLEEREQKRDKKKQSKMKMIKVKSM
ncbi:Coiled-coil domain-containing protein 47 [Cichlidogyrus casuarinus]|uniref:PAT complex subunit CCDC47 n=1 Tax=Cichlidogyrus casuarinus TaxID=1844966 RepID=A0ABD2QID9_9PLAT